MTPQTISIAHNAVTAKLVGADREVKLVVREALSYLVDGAVHMGKIGWDGMSSFFDFKHETFPAGFVYLVYAKLLSRGYKVQLVRKPFPKPLGPEDPVVDTFGYDPKYDYQPEVKNKLLKHGQIIAQVATGGGKSRIAKICYKRIGRKTMFLTTRGVLMYQMKRAIEEMGEKCGVIGDDNWIEHDGFNVCMVQTLAPLLEAWTLEGQLERYIANQTAAEDREVLKLLTAHKKLKTDPRKLPALTASLRQQLVAARKPDAIVERETKVKVAKHNEKRLDVIKLLASMELTILEEAHESSGDGYYRIMRHCPNAHYRLALTATPFMKDSQKDNMQLMACSGPVAIKVSEQELIKRGVLAKPYFKFISLKDMTPSYVDEDGYTHKLFRSTPWPKCFQIGVTNNLDRNTTIVNEAHKAVLYGMPVMILVTARKHGQILQSMISNRGILVNYIFGDHDQNERQAALNALRDGRISVLIGSNILDVGVDVPAVGTVILAGGGKAEVSLRQRIGRGLRAKKSGPNIAFVIDFREADNSTLREHAKERRWIIESTPGFKDGIVSSFDYSGFGLKRVA